MFDINKLKSNILFQQFVAYSSQNFTEGLQELLPALEKLPLSDRSRMIAKGFSVACSGGRLNTAQYLLEEPFYQLQSDLPGVYSALSCALYREHINVVEYILVNSPLDIKNKASEDYYRRANTSLFLGLCAIRHIPLNSGLPFLVDFIETHTFERNHSPLNLGTDNNYEGFQIAWKASNELVAEFLIKRYGITGQEASIGQYIKDLENQVDPQVAQRLKRLMQINQEKSLMEEQLKISDIGTDKDKRAHKI